MSYRDMRTREIKKNLLAQLEHWLDESPYDPKKPTVCLLPGTPGSQLDQTMYPYYYQPLEYRPLWLRLGLFLAHEIRFLRLTRLGVTEALDYPECIDEDERIIVANGPVRTFSEPYDETEEYFRKKGYNYLVFGYDWRRSPIEAAYYLKFFLKSFRDRVGVRTAGRAGWSNPLSDTTIVCHSNGGLVGKIFIQLLHLPATGDGVEAWFSRLITVGSPFMGRMEQLDTYYQGVPGLNLFEGKGGIAMLTASLPGPYALITMDLKTYTANKTVLKQDGLGAFPVMGATGQAPVDPFDSANYGRYPGFFNLEYLEHARDVKNLLLSEMPPVVANRVFHIRSGLDSNTSTSARWAPVPGHQYDPDQDQSPFTWKKSAGDGTVPYWSARLPQTPSANILDCQSASVHGELLEHPEVLGAIHQLIKTGTFAGAPPVPLAYAPPTAGVTDREVKQFLLDARYQRLGSDDARLGDRALMKKILQTMAI